MQWVRRCYALTLRVSFPFGSTAVLALIILAVIVAVAEWVLRLPAVQNQTLLVPSIGSAHREFEAKLFLLEKAADQAPIDCFFLGSSIVDRALNPIAFEPAYAAQTGQTLRCFNLGVNGGGEDVGLTLSRLLIADYQPVLLVFGISARLHSGGQVSVEIAHLPWYRTQIGEFSLRGWLATHSALYRYGPVGLRWIAGTTLMPRVVDRLARSRGYMPTDEVMPLPLSARDQKRIQTSDYRLFPEDRARLERMFALHDPPRLQVVIVELPVHPLALEAKATFRRDYEAWARQVAQLAGAHGVPFWATTTLGLLPDQSNWADVNHLNTQGSQRFSAWLGEQVGRAVQEGRLARPLLR